MTTDDMNFSLIPGELADPGKRRGLGHRARENENKAFDRGLEVVGCGMTGAAPEQKGPKSLKPTGAVSSTVGASAALPGKAPPGTAAKAGTPAGSVSKGAPASNGSTSENYRAAMLRKRREQAEAATKNVSAQEYQARIRQKNHEDAERSRARDLSDKLQYWKGQQYQEGQDQNAVVGNISQIEQQLNSIDQKFRD